MCVMGTALLVWHQQLSSEWLNVVVSGIKSIMKENKETL